MEQYFHNKNIEDLKNFHIHKQQKVLNKHQNVTSKINGGSFKLGDVTVNKSCSNLQEGISKTEKFSNSCKKLNDTNVYCKEGLYTKKTKVPERYNSLPKEIGRYRPIPKVAVRQNKIKPIANIVQTQFEDSELKKTDVKLKNQGVQTMNDDQLDNLYIEGTIRYLIFKKYRYNCVNIILQNIKFLFLKNFEGTQQREIQK